ncbi:MAG: WYL domain-containing protein [Chitinophagales bacterium]
MSTQGTIKKYTLILEKLKHRHYPTKREIQEYFNGLGFNLTDRTFERHLEALRIEFGIQIIYDTWKKGYYLDEEASLNLKSFHKFINLSNVASLLTESLKDGKELLQYVSFDDSSLLTGIENLEKLLRATKEQRKIKFEHFNFYTQKTKQYSLKPYLLKEYKSRWYVIGTIFDTSDLRSFGIERINGLEVTDELFERDEALNPKEKFEEIIGLIYSDRKIQTVKLSFSMFQAEYIKSLKLHHSQKVVSEDKAKDECLIELFLKPNFELEQQILMHGENVKVLEPQWLVDRIRDRLKEALGYYS